MPGRRKCPIFANMKRLTTTTTLIAAAIWAHAALAAPPPKVRVMVHEGPSVAPSGLGATMKLTTGDEFRGRHRNIGKLALITAGDSGLLFRGEPLGRRASVRSGTSRYAIDEREFRGELELVWKSKSKLIVVNHLPLEDYLVGLIGSEMYPSWPVEAFKAQAVAARTYALHHADRSGANDYDVTSTVLSQVYEGAHKEVFLARKAVEATRGLVLTRKGAVFPSYYHSCCGGLTEHAHNVWEGELGPPQVVDNYCEASPKRSWTERMSLTSFGNALRAAGIEVGEISDVHTRPEMDSPRVENVFVEHSGGIEVIRAAELRAILGYSKIKSTWFELENKGGQLRFKGHGYGHGVGMCQWGAKGMADRGMGYRDILKFYYADAEIRQAY